MAPRASKKSRTKKSSTSVDSNPANSCESPETSTPRAKKALTKKRRFVQDDDDDTYSLGSMENLVNADIPIASRERLGLACNVLCAKKEDANELAVMLESVVALCARARGPPSNPVGPDKDHLKMREYRLQEKEKELARRQEQQDLISQESMAENEEQSNQVHSLRGEVVDLEKQAKDYKHQIEALQGELAKAKKTISMQEKDHEAALAVSEKKVETLTDKCVHLEKLEEENASSLRVEQERGQALEHERAGLAAKEAEMNRVIGEGDELRRGYDELKETSEQMKNYIKECEGKVEELKGFGVRNEQLEREKEQEQKKKEAVYDKWVSSKAEQDKTVGNFDEVMQGYGKSTYGGPLVSEDEEEGIALLDQLAFIGDVSGPLPSDIEQSDSATVCTESSFAHPNFVFLNKNTIDGEEKTALFLGKSAHDRSRMLLEMLDGAGMNPFTSVPEAVRFRARYRYKREKKFDIVGLVRDFYCSYLGIEHTMEQSDELVEAGKQLKKNMRYRVQRAAIAPGKPLFIARAPEAESAAI